MSASTPGRRAVVRWAWRMFRRDWRQQALVLALVTVAVAAAVAGTAMVVEAASSNHGFGDANALVQVEGTPAEQAATVAAVRDRFGEVEVVPHQSVAVPGATDRIDLRAQGPGGRFSDPLLRLRDGRLPTAEDEIALTPDVADLLDTAIGGTVEVDRRTWTVVGEVEDPSQLGDEFALVAPDTPLDSATVLFDRFSRGPQATGSGNGPSFGIQAIGDDDAAVAAVVLVVVTLAMSLTALVAAAGFVVVAQRRQRQLGLLAALGATERHLRLVLVANGTIVGVVAAAIGGVLGVAGWIVTAPAVEEAARHRIDRFDLPWGLIATCLVLAVVASTAAAWWPARAMARQPVMAALARRPGPPARTHRSVAVALALLVGGAVAIDASDPLGVTAPLVLVGGVVAVITGTVLAAPAALRLLSAIAPRLPFAPRLALRDLVRYQARASGALGAVALGLAVSIAVVVVAAANVVGPDEGNLSDRQLLVEPVEVVVGTDLDAAAAAVAEPVGAHSIVPLSVVYDPRAEPGSVDFVEVGRPTSGGFRGVDVPYVATPEVLAHFGIDPGSIEPSTELLTSIPGAELRLFDPLDRGDDLATTVIQPVELGTYTQAPRSLVTEAAMAAHGWEARPVAWLVEADHALTDDEIDATRAAAAARGLAVQLRNDQDSLAAVRTAATAVGVLLALAIVAVAITLLRGEAAQDVRTLTATGATARTRRLLTATTAGALATLGVGLSAIGAYTAVLAAYSSDLARLTPVPVTDLVAIVLGLPLLATAAGWLLAGRDPASITRQAFD